MSALLGLIGGSGLDQYSQGLRLATFDTPPWGKSSDGFTEIDLPSGRLLFLPRHGYDHRFAPHKINYRANIMAFKKIGVQRILAINAVGSMSATMPPGSLVLADQLIDYTWGRAHTYYEDNQSTPTHIEFAEPFSKQLREQLLEAATKTGIEVHGGGTLAVTQGPRLETAAEIRKYTQDGCDLVGMTTMPEAALAREAGLEYATLCIVANRAAGLGTGGTIDGMQLVLEAAMQQIDELIPALV